MNPISDCAAIKTICTLNTSTDLLSFSLFFFSKGIWFLTKRQAMFLHLDYFSPSELKLKKRKQKKPHTLPLKMLTIVAADPKKGKENL